MFKQSLLSRRHFLCLSTSGLAGAIALAATDKYSLFQNQAVDHLNRDFKVIGQASLKQRAAAKGLIYGAAGIQSSLASNKEFAAIFAKQCGILVPDYDLKWDTVRPTPNSFDFTKSDWLLNFARTHGILFRGHNLVWYQALPKWFKEVVNRQNAEQFLVEHIQTVVKHYAGKVHSWDVVNEVIDPDNKRSDGLGASPWLDFLGIDYIELAFRAAAQADPKALLVYNEDGLQYDIPKHEARRTAVLKLLEHLKSRGTPIHALGMESHLHGHETHVNAKKLRKFLADVASLGLKILITELDVTDQKLPKNRDIRDRIVASAYEDYLSVVLDEPAVIAVLTWGLSDRYTWLSKYAPRADNLPVRTLPLDSNLKPKLAWNAIARAFDHAPKR